MTMTDFGNAIADAVTDAVDRLRDETVDGELVRSVDEWAEVIRDDLDIANEGIISAGRHLIEAKRDVGHGNWLPLLEQIGIHERAAQRLIQIGSNEALTNPTNLSGLPSALSALVELAGVEPDELQQAIESGDVTPQTTAKDAKALKGQKQANAERVTAIREWAATTGRSAPVRGRLPAALMHEYDEDVTTWLEAEREHRAERVALTRKYVAVAQAIEALTEWPDGAAFMTEFADAELDESTREALTHVGGLVQAITFLESLRHRAETA